MTSKEKVDSCTCLSSFSVVQSSPRKSGSFEETIALVCFTQYEMLVELAILAMTNTLPPKRSLSEKVKLMGMLLYFHESACKLKKMKMVVTLTNGG